MRKGLFLALSALLFVLISYLAHLWLSFLGDFPANFSPLFPEKLLPGQVSKPVARRVIFILYDGPVAKLEGGAQFKILWPDVPGFYTPYAMILTGAPPELTGIYFAPSTLKVGNLLEEVAKSGRRVALSGPGWWKDFLGPSAEKLYACFFASPKHYGDIVPEMARFVSFFDPDFLFLHIPEGSISLEEAISRLGFDASQDLLAILAPNSFVLLGKGVVPDYYGEASLLDIAPTLAAASGSPPPAVSRGTPFLQAFSLPDELKALKLVSVASQRVSLADFYSKELLGQGLDEGLKGDAKLALNSLELGNPYGAMELAGLTLKEADLAIDKARAEALAAGRWRRLPLFLLWVLVWPIILTLIYRRQLLVPFLAGLLSFTLNAWLFRQEWPYLSWDALIRMGPSPFALKRTLLSLYIPALLPLLWLLLEEEEETIEAGESLASYGLWALYFTSLPVAFSFLLAGPKPAYFIPPLGLYVAQLMGLWQLFLSGLLALPLPFVGMGIFAPFKWAKLLWRTKP
jgi:hypothetical protein